jgi:hypothetical protein
MKTIINKILLFCCLAYLSSKAVQAQNGLYFDADRNFLIPMMEENILKGHAYMYLLDKINKDTNSFVLQIFDEYLRDVGEKKVVVPSSYIFKAAIYNGSHFIAKFADPKSGLRYFYFDQKGERIFDTLIQCKPQKEEALTYKTFASAPMYSIPNQGVLDYNYVVQDGKAEMCLMFLGNDFKSWKYILPVDGKKGHMELLAADHQYIANTVYRYDTPNMKDGISTSILLLSAGGVKITEQILSSSDSISVYPVAAEIKKEGIEIFAQFEKRTSKYAKTKFGASVHQLYFNGQQEATAMNEFTSTLIKDSLCKKYKLFIHSYLYLHKAIRLNSGNWLVAAEQFQRTKIRSKPFVNKYVYFSKKNIALMELDSKANLVQMHVEPNKSDAAKVPKAFYRKPHLGAVVMNLNQRLDISYFLKENRTLDDKISFVYTDVQAEARKIALGNLLYDNGKISVDRFNIPRFSMFTRVAVLPARFGHVMLVKLDPVYGRFDIDQVKFNN